MLIFETFRCDRVFLYFSLLHVLHRGTLLFYRRCYMWVYYWVKDRQYSIFPKNWKSLKTFCENLFEKVSKMKIMSRLYFSIFHALRHGILGFYHSILYLCAFLGVKSKIFSFSNKLKISQNVLSKSLWQSFENESYELTIF